MYVLHSLQIDEDSLGVNGDQKEKMEKNSETKEEGDSVNLKQVWITNEDQNQSKIIQSRSK